MTASPQSHPQTDNTAEAKTYPAPLNVAALSLDIAEADPAENLRRAKAMLDLLPQGVEVAVLPELFTTAFMSDSERMLSMAEYRTGPTVKAIRKWATEKQMLISGSFLGKEAIAGGAHEFFNRGFIATPDGEIKFYDKHHLFCLSDEARILTHGRMRPPLVEFKGWHISMIICYELRFPVWSRNVDMQTELLLIPANWPQARGYAWDTLIRARAIENQQAVIGADRSGKDEYGTYDGLSMIVDELGRPIAPPLSHPLVGCPPPTAPGSVTESPYGPILTATLSFDKLMRWRRWLPTDRDADRFTLH